MDVEKLKILSDLKIKGILSEAEFQNEKNKILGLYDENKTVSDLTKISKAGQNFLNVFYALFFLLLFAVIAVILLYYDQSYYQAVFLTSLLVETIVFIVVFRNLYLAGKHLKYSVTTILNNNRVSASDKLEYDEYIQHLQQKNEKLNRSITVLNQCPACLNMLNKEDTECSNCGLNFG